MLSTDLKMTSKWKLNLLGIALVIVFITIDFSIFSHLFQSIDISLFYSINTEYSSPILDFIMVLLTTYGRELFWSVLIVAIFVLGGEEGKKTAFLLGVLFALLTVLGYSLKLLEFRYRPFQTLNGVRLLISPEYDSSFPSGHALIVMGGAAITWLRMKKILAIPIGIESFLVAFSRIYVGVHYPLDVLSGSILGVALAFLIVGQTNNLMILYNKIMIRNSKKVS